MLDCLTLYSNMATYLITKEKLVLGTVIFSFHNLPSNYILLNAIDVSKVAIYEFSRQYMTFL